MRTPRRSMPRSPRPRRPVPRSCGRSVTWWEAAPTPSTSSPTRVSVVAVALMGNHDYGATGSAEPTRFGEPESPAVRSIELARERLSDDQLDWMRGRKPAGRRAEVQCWHGEPAQPRARVRRRVERRSVPARPEGRARPRRPHPRRRGVAADAARRAAGEAPRRRALRPHRRQVAAQPGRGRRAGTDPARLVGRPRRAGRHRRLLALARPRPPHRDLAPSAVRPGSRARARALGLDGPAGSVSCDPRSRASGSARRGRPA